MDEGRPEEGLAAEDLGPGEAEDMFETDEDREVYRLIGQNPLLERVQVALKKQLTATSTRVEVKLREEEEDLKRVKQRREDLGVELYGVQQRLARLQMDLESKHSHVATVQAIRSDSEKRMAEAEKEAKWVVVVVNGTKQDLLALRIADGSVRFVRLTTKQDRALQG